MATIRIGPAGWSYKDWVGIVYPKRRPAGFHEATYLAHYFDTIELNVTFYRPIAAATAADWIGRVAHNARFQFTVKLWQEFTHSRNLTAANEKTIRPAMEVLRDAGRLGTLLAQFPWSFKNDVDNLAYLAKLVERFKDFPLVVEVRHSSWDRPEIYEWLADRGVGFCNVDQPIIGRSLKPSERVTSPVGYVRLHGRRYDTWFSDNPELPSHERYNYLYSVDELKPWVERIRHVTAQSETVFVVTNNHFEGKGVVNALQLVHALTNHTVNAPPMLVEHYPELATICTTEATTLGGSLLPFS